MISPISNSIPLQISKHAEKRLEQDGFQLTPDHASRIRHGVERAESKGAKESLFLMDDKAFIVNIRDRVLVTHIARERLKENVFTNIDSAVII